MGSAMCTEREPSNNSELDKLKKENSRLTTEIASLHGLKYEISKLNAELLKYTGLFSTPEPVANYIMSTNLHVKWMDDDTERAYIISLLAFLKKFIEEGQPDGDSDSELL